MPTSGRERRPPCEKGVLPPGCSRAGHGARTRPLRTVLTAVLAAGWPTALGAVAPTPGAAPVAETSPARGAAQVETSPAQGRQLYEEHCALCHGDSGAGRSPVFPALRGNERLGNAARIVRAVREGAGNMPPFPALNADETAALASYVRTAWTNDFGAVTAADAAAVLDRLADPGPAASAWDGVFTEAQAARGRQVYAGACALCHGRRLNGAPDDPDMVSTPPLARARFLRQWEGRSLAALVAYTRATMPEDNPGSLAEQEYVDIVAYLLSMSRMPAGDGELSSDLRRLADIVLGPSR